MSQNEPVQDKMLEEAVGLALQNDEIRERLGETGRKPEFFAARLRERAEEIRRTASEAAKTFLSASNDLTAGRKVLDAQRRGLVEELREGLSVAIGIIAAGAAANYYTRPLEILFRSEVFDFAMGRETFWLLLVALSVGTIAGVVSNAVLRDWLTARRAARSQKLGIGELTERVREATDALRSSLVQDGAIPILRELTTFQRKEG